MRRKPRLRLTLKQKTFKVLNRDQWMSFLDFSNTVSENFEEYEDDGACT